MQLKKQAQALREDPASVRRLPGAATTEAVSQLRAGLNYLSEMARSYDEQYQMTTSLRAAVDTTKETANRALSEITAQVQRVTGRSPRDVVPSIADSDGKSAAPPSAAAKDALADASAALADASDAVQDESKDAGAGVRERVAAAYSAVQDVATRVREFEARNVDAAKGAFELAGFLEVASGWPRPGGATPSKPYATQWESLQMLFNDYDFARHPSFIAV